MSKITLYTFDKLSRKAKKKAIKDYLGGWSITHEEDDLDPLEVEEILMSNSEEEGPSYTKAGKYVGGD
jgi:hypothetical protein